MLTSQRNGGNLEDLALLEAEELIKNMFVRGEYRSVAENNNINSDDIKMILPKIFLLINRQLISFTIVLIMKPENDFRDVYIGYGGTGKCFRINSNEVIKLTTEEKEINEITTERIKKSDAFLLCSCEVAESLDNKPIQQSLRLFKEPEELCKRLIFATYNRVGIGNFSAAVFFDSKKSKWRVKTTSVKWGGIFLLLVISAILINNFAFRAKTVDISKNKDVSSSLDTPPVIINQSPHKVLVPDVPAKSTSNAIKPQVKKTNYNRNVDFLTNGSVVMITNWSAVEKDISYINWEPNQSSKKRIYKYPDYTQIPGSVKVTFKDNTTRVFIIKNK